MAGRMMINKEVTGDAPESVRAAVAAVCKDDPTGAYIVGENASPDNPDPVLSIMRDGVIVGFLAIAYMLKEGIDWLYK